jgi:lipoprotein NlpD
MTVSLPRAIAVGVVCCFLACGCAATPATSARPATASGTGSATYVVRPQDTLYGIAWRHNLDYRELAKWNHIDADYKLTVGQVLVLQPGGGRQGASRAAASSSSVTGAPAKQANGGSNGAAGANGAANASGAAGANGAANVGGGAGANGTANMSGSRVGKPRPLGDASAAVGRAPGVGGAVGAGGVGAGAAASGGAGAPETAIGGGKWVWPTDRVSAPRPVPGGGILVLGQLGQDVRAAASGRVVYTGSGLRGYGNLIIIKHGDSLLSSYAHNREMLVHEGQDVTAGQVIAHMGTGPHQISALYFEIRVNGKPVDPLRYLSASR